MAAKLKTDRGWADADCTLRCEPIKAYREVMVAIDHEHCQFVTEAEAVERGEAVSLYSVRSSCAEVIPRASRCMDA